MHVDLTEEQWDVLQTAAFIARAQMRAEIRRLEGDDSPTARTTRLYWDQLCAVCNHLNRDTSA